MSIFSANLRKVLKRKTSWTSSQWESNCSVQRDRQWRTDRETDRQTDRCDSGKSRFSLYY